MINSIFTWVGLGVFVIFCSKFLNIRYFFLVNYQMNWLFKRMKEQEFHYPMILQLQLTFDIFNFSGSPCYGITVVSDGSLKSEK